MDPDSAGANHTRRKQVRATQACNHCRSRKQKCDEAKPCQFCRENNFECQYKDVPPPKQDRSMMQLQDSVNNTSKILREFVKNFNIWKQHVDGKLDANSSSALKHASPQQSFAIRNSASEQHTPRIPSPVQGRNQDSRVNSMKIESPIVTHSHVSLVPAQESTPIKKESSQSHSAQPVTPASSVATPHAQILIDLLSDNQQTGLKANHRTPAHRLFVEWPGMIHYCDGLNRIERLRNDGERIDQYPMLMEQGRGLLRVWGVGEGHDFHDGSHGPSSPEHYNDFDNYSTASTKEGLWGYPPADYPSPNILNGDVPRRENVGGLGPDGRPDFRHGTLWSLYQLYQDNIHNLHPFLNPAKLRGMFEEFEEMYSPDRRNSTPSPSAVPERLNGGIKRKRSSGVYGDAYRCVDDLARGSIEPSLRNAIVLLVLALGKVCSSKDPLPHPCSDKSHASRDYHWDSPRSLHDSFDSDASDNRQRNIDILPGMAYFAYATNILGNQIGANTVAHAQAMLLAGLYIGQFVRFLESWSWISIACRICLVLVKREGKKLHRTKIVTNDKGEPVAADTNEEAWNPEERYRLNLIKIVYWTCLQMESDIIAEISELQPSAITEHQINIAYPSDIYESFNEGAQTFGASQPTSLTNNMFIYSSQIHLRVLLNDAHNSLYSARLGFASNNLDDIGDMARSHADLLANWRRLLPAPLGWNDSDPPSTNINVARMRAKYYGGYYVVLRPLLFKAVHCMEVPPAFLSDSVSASSYLVNLSVEDANTLTIVESCIKSAIQSTVAFDRVGASEHEPYERYISQRKTRLIVPNIFGTLHAQFGNILVLTAVYRSDMRKYLPDQNCLTHRILTQLYQRTQDILDEMGENSPALATDYEILEKAAQVSGIDYDRAHHKRAWMA